MRNYRYYFRLSEDCLYTEEPQVARWDYKKHHWRLDGFSDYNYNEGLLCHTLQNISGLPFLCGNFDIVCQSAFYAPFSKTAKLTLSQTSPGFYGLQYKSFVNTVGKGEIARYKQFLLFPQCFLPVWKTFFHFNQIQNC